MKELRKAKSIHPLCTASTDLGHRGSSPSTEAQTALSSANSSSSFREIQTLSPKWKRSVRVRLRHLLEANFTPRIHNLFSSSHSPFPPSCRSMSKLTVRPQTLEILDLKQQQMLLKCQIHTFAVENHSLTPGCAYSPRCYL